MDGGGWGSGGRCPDSPITGFRVENTLRDKFSEISKVEREINPCLRGIMSVLDGRVDLTQWNGRETRILRQGFRCVGMEGHQSGCEGKDRFYEEVWGK